jgi:hypothetical protein
VPEKSIDVLPDDGVAFAGDVFERRKLRNIGRAESLIEQTPRAMGVS